MANISAQQIRILQLTDTHLFADPEAELLGVNCQQSLQRVIRHAREHHWPPDLILLTGDLTHDESATAYQHLRSLFLGLNVPVYALPGNHDKPEMLKEYFFDEALKPERLIQIGDWLIVLLNSALPNDPAGHLAAEELVFLSSALARQDYRFALVALHHHPVSIDSPWMDGMMVDNGDALLALLDGEPRMRGVVWGHIHQTFDAKRGPIRLLGTPATCCQFQPYARQLTVDAKPPGYRWLHLNPNGSLDTGVERVAAGIE